MKEVSIQITIAGRPYPLTVSENDVERIEAAAKQINAFADQFSQDFGVSDKQDVLAMAALHLTSQAGQAPAPATEPVAQIDSIESTQAMLGLEELRSLLGKSNG
jgi:cell division protein ZapA (FtsZ GTPase activity inhibitor)